MKKSSTTSLGILSFYVEIVSADYRCAGQVNTHYIVYFLNALLLCWFHSCT